MRQTYSQCGINNPVRHQEEAWRRLSESKSVIIRAPTGSGKTEAVVLPFLNFRGNELPLHLLYALPLRSLANQIAERIEKYAQKLSKSSLRVRLQHGERPESVLFASDIVVATIDQVVTSYACTPLTLPVRHGNIPAGAVMSSFLVFDEAHLFDPNLGLQATRLICERLHRLGIPYAVLSATLPDSIVEFWHDELGAEVVEAYSEFVPRQVIIDWRDSLLTPEEIKTFLQKFARILVVCNTVDRAVEIYRGVLEEARKQGYECELIHSRFLPDDRKRKEEWVQRHFGKDHPPDTRALLIATQVVEVGLDISADLLLTEVAPVDALIQRAGRVARWGGEGKVWVYDVTMTAPYSKDLVDKTKEVLLRNSGINLDWATAKCWVNQVLNDTYREILHESSAYEQVVAQLSRAAFEGSRTRAEAAVRDVNTVEVTVHSEPKKLGKDVLRLPTISVHIGIVKKWVEEAKRTKSKVFRIEVDREPSDAQVKVHLECIRSDDIVIGDRLIFPPSVLNYSDEWGLQSGSGGADFQPLAPKEAQPPGYRWSEETWNEHSVKTVQAMEEILDAESKVVSALASLLMVPEKDVWTAARVAAALHDLGKLSKEWQSRAGVSVQAEPEKLLAHTGNRNYEGFPPHATVSAYALWPALVDDGAFPRLFAKAVCFAIAHHHSVRAKEVTSYEFHRAWREAVEKVLRQCGLSDVLNLDQITYHQPSKTNLREQFPPLEYERLYTAYVLLSRWLRLADRIATGGGEDALFRYEDWFGGL